MSVAERTTLTAEAREYLAAQLHLLYVYGLRGVTVERQEFADRATHIGLEVLGLSNKADPHSPEDAEPDGQWEQS